VVLYKQIMIKLINILYESVLGNVDDINYELRYPNKNTIIKLNINKVLKKHKHDEPKYSIDSRTSKNVISKNRIESSKEFWLNYSKDQRWINPRTKRRSLFPDMIFHPSIVMFDNNGKFGFVDGRHRLIAMKELGYKYAYFEVPKRQAKLFTNLT